MASFNAKVSAPEIIQMNTYWTRYYHILENRKKNPKSTMGCSEKPKGYAVLGR